MGFKGVLWTSEVYRRVSPYSTYLYPQPMGHEPWVKQVRVDLLSPACHPPTAPVSKKAHNCGLLQVQELITMMTWCVIVIIGAEEGYTP